MSNTDWGAFNDWGLVLPPNRPTKEYLRTLWSLVKHVPKEHPVAVLGSTPEIRDVFAQTLFEEVYVFDRSPVFFDIATAQRCFRNSEHFVGGDWLDSLVDYRHTFAIIASDLTAGNIPRSSMDRFFQRVAGSLKTDGVFIDRLLLHRGKFKKISELDSYFQSAPLNLFELNRFSSEYLFLSELVRDYHGVDSTLFLSLLQARNNGPRIAKFLSEVTKITPQGGIWSYGDDECIKTAFDHYFLLREELPDAVGTFYEEYTSVRLARPRHSADS